MLEQSNAANRSPAIVPRVIGDRAMRRYSLPVFLMAFLLVACGSASTATPIPPTATAVVAPATLPPTPAPALPTATASRETCTDPSFGTNPVRINTPPLATRQAKTQADLQTLGNMERKWQAANILNY